MAITYHNESGAGILMTMIALILPFMLVAALPPLSADELRENSTHIVIGRVSAIYSTPSGKNNQFAAEIIPLAWEKGASETGLLYGRYWTAGGRPDGWTGDGGQRCDVSLGDTARFFLRRDADGGFSLLHPNGSESLLGWRDARAETNALMAVVGDFFAAAESGRRDRALMLFAPAARAREETWEKSFTRALFDRSFAIRSWEVRPLRMMNGKPVIDAGVILVEPSGALDREGMQFTFTWNDGRWMIEDLR